MRHQGKQFLIPAGVLIGLGIGLITGYAAACLLIGLGLGLLGSAFFRHSDAGMAETTGGCCGHRGSWGTAIAGIFMILIGVSLILAPMNFWTYIWPYGIGIFLILLGLSFIARILWKTG